ncbi:MAG TPA: hypothetical protein VLX91_13870 [Candidatus Acidoferrales bacterium]|nr:hypothetical protein [Candidatus Acidoferrales bacterium]
MKKLVVMILIVSFAAFGTIAIAGEIPTKTKSDSTMTKKMTEKNSKKSSNKGKWSKSKKMTGKKKTSAKKDNNTSEPKEK